MGPPVLVADETGTMWLSPSGGPTAEPTDESKALHKCKDSWRGVGTVGTSGSLAVS